MPILRMIAADEILQIRFGHRMLLERKIHIGSEIIDPDVLRLHLRTGRSLIKEANVRLDARLIEDARRQAQDRMQFCGLQKLLADNLTGSCFKEHVIRQYNHRSACRLQDGIDVLNKIELLIGGGHSEILAAVDQIHLFLLTLLVGHGDGVFLAERRIGQHIIHAIARIHQQRIA